MSYTVGQAAKATGKSKPTISRAIKSGKISANRNDNGSYSINPAELHRVFSPVSSNSNDNATMTQAETLNGMSALRVEIVGLREHAAILKSERDDLRRRLDQETEERRKLTTILTDQRSKRRWWPFGGDSGG